MTLFPYAHRTPLALLCGLLFLICGVGCDKAEEPSAKVADKVPSTKGVFMDFILLERTEHPDPKSSEYADCLYTAKLQVVDDDAPEGTEPKIILAAIPAFFDRKPVRGHELAPGDRFRAGWTPFEKAAEKFRKMQTADRFGDFLLEYHMIIDPKLVRRGEPLKPQTVAAGNQPAPVIPPERFVRRDGSGPEEVRRKARIARELARMQAELDANGGSWDAWMEKLEPHQEELLQRSKAADWTLSKDQHVFTRLGLQCYHDLTQDAPHVGPVAALRLLNAELKRHGIDLVVVPFPAKEDVNGFKFLAEDAPRELNPCRIRFLMRLPEMNIEVIDLVPPLRDALDDHPFVFYDNRDAHPADGAIQVAGQAVARVLADYDLVPVPATPLPVASVEFVIKEDTEHFVKGKRYPATKVLYPPGTKAHRQVLLQGDSFLNVPTNHVLDATVADHIGRHVGYRLDTLVREAGANQILQDLARLPKSTLEGRKVLFFIFGPTRLRSPHSPLMSPDLHWHLALLPE